jgi:selenocysteine-specific elongation factor
MLAEPGVWTTTTRFSAEIRVARYADDLQHKADYQLHAGSGAQRAEIQRVSDGYAVIRLSMPLPLQTGDRFILRDTGRKLVVAGGRVLDPQPGPLKAAMRAARLISADSGPDSVATELLDIRGIDTLTTLAAHSGGGLPAAALVAGDVAVSKRALGDLASRCRDLVGADHAEHPLRPGIPLATLGTKLGLSLEIVEALIDVTEGLQRIGPDVRSVDHRPDLSDGQRERWLAARAKLEETLAVPPANDLGLETELIHLLVRQGLLIRVSAELVILPQQADQVRSLIRAMDDGFTVAEFRDAAVLSRKYSVPFLEWADKEGLTIRRGDLRFVR